MRDTDIRPIPSWRRLCQVAIDVVVFYGVWVAVLDITKVRFPFGFMQKFSQQDYDAYVRIMGWMTLVLFALSIVLHSTAGGSIGKLLMRHKTLQAKGTPATLQQAAARSAILFLTGLAILAPGPLVAFVFRAGSEAASLTVLLIGITLWAVTTVPFKDGRSMLESYLGLVTARIRDLKGH